MKKYAELNHNNLIGEKRKSYYKIKDHDISQFNSFNTTLS
jgi:hypothetical protein